MDLVLLSVHIKISAYTVPIHEKVEACRQAIREKGAVDQIIMQGIFFGLLRSGKTSTKKHLTGQKPALEQANTGSDPCGNRGAATNN